MKSLVKVLLCLAAISPLSVKADSCFFDGCGACCDEYYFSVWGGGNVPFDNHPRLDTGWYVGGALGMRYSPCMRFDVSFDYLRNELDNESGSYSSSGVTTDTGSGSSSNGHDVSKYVALVNGYWDFETCGCFQPYIGAGIGYAYISTPNHHRHKHQRNSFAWQVGAGVNYEVNECWTATASYRLLGTTTDDSGYHNLFGVGLTRRF